MVDECCGCLIVLVVVYLLTVLGLVYLVICRIPLVGVVL